jgi:hypothetical protein
MCGLTGIAGEITIKEESVFKQLLIVDSLRGVDSTGVAIIPRHGEVKVAKELGNPYNLFDHKSFDRALMGAHKVLIGHNRYATVGGVSKKAAHPFEFETVVGVHNGTLSSKWKLENSHDFTVDSENLYHHINKKGIKDALSKMKGAWSLVWWDKTEGTLNFLRNTERPLWMCRSLDGKNLFWASEDWMLSGILARNDIKHGDLFSTEVDMHYSIAIDATGSMSKAHVSNAPSTYQESAPTGYFPGVQASKPVAVINNYAISQPTVKKVRVTPKTVDSIDSYKPLGHVKLEIIGANKDQFGSSYFQCMDRNAEGVNIRLYYTRLPLELGHFEDLIGGSIIGAINPNPTITSRSKYYKVITSSVNWNDLEFDDPHIDITDAYDHRNNLIDVGSWQKAYGECAWCGSPVYHDKRHALTTDGQALCSDCCVDDSPNGAKQYVNVVGGIRNKEYV